MRRHAVGIIALALLLGALYFHVWPPEELGYQQFEAAFWRVGVLMAVLWLAYKELSRLPIWLGWTIPVLGAVLAWKPKWLVIAVPIVIALAILKPKARARKETRP